MDTSETAQSKSPAGNRAAANVKTRPTHKSRRPGRPRPNATSRAMPNRSDSTTSGRPRPKRARNGGVCGYPVHPAAAIFPPITDRELQVLADDIAKNGQRHDIVLHSDGSILDGLNRLRACAKAGVEPRITKWDGKPGEELAFVISQNVRRRQLKRKPAGHDCQQGSGSAQRATPGRQICRGSHTGSSGRHDAGE